MSVRKRGSRWHCDFQVRGVRYRIAIPEARNKRQAELAEAQLRIDVFERKFGEGVSANFADFVADIYQPWAKQKRSYQSEVIFINAALAFFKPFSLSEISPMMVERYKRQRMNTPVRANGKSRKPATVNREMACLSRIFTMAVDNGLLRVNPSSKVKRLREDNARTRYLTDDEEARLFAAIIKPFERIRSILILALNTGMRQGEIVGLKWSEIDWQRDLILVTNTKNAVARTIPMNETVRLLLTELWRERDQSKASLFNMTARTVCFSFKRLVRHAGLVDFKFHDLRHTFATRLAPHTDAFTLAALLGHQTLSMTSRYTHPTDEGKRRAMVAFSKDGHKNVTIEFPASSEKAG